MDLLVLYLRRNSGTGSNNVVIDSIGDIDELPEVCREELASAYQRTKANTGVHLYLA